MKKIITKRTINKFMSSYKTPNFSYNSGQVEKLRWYPYKKIRFSKLVKKQPKKAL